MPSRRDAALAGVADRAAEIAEARRRQDLLVARARHAGASWQQIADALGVSAQAAHKRYRAIRYDPKAGRAWQERQLML